MPPDYLSILNEGEPAVRGALPGTVAFSRGAGADYRSILDEDDTDKPGVVEAIVRGGANAATLGFADELAGGLESMFTDKSYKQARDESRAAYSEAKEAHPLAYGAGQVGGTLATFAVPGLGLAKGASAAATIARAGIQGAAGGLGQSTAELTEGDVGGAARDTAIGAGAGLAAGAVGAGLGAATRGYVAAAPGRAAEHAADAATRAPLGARVSEAVGERLKDGGGLAVLGAIASGSPGGALAGLTPLVTKGALAGVKAVDRKMTAAASKLIEAAAAGNDVAAARLAAIEAGVPDKAIRGILSAYRTATSYVGDQ